MRTLRSLLLLLLLGSVAGPVAAQERLRVAIVRPDAPRADALRSMMRDAVEAQSHEVIDDLAVDGAVVEFGVSGETGVDALAEAVDAEVVLQSAPASGDGRSLSITARTADGQLVGTRPWRVRRDRRGREELAEALDTVMALAAATVANQRLAAAERARAEEPVAPVESTAVQARPPSEAAARSDAAPPLVVAWLTLSGRSRSAVVRPTGGRADRQFDSGLYPEIGVALEVRPLSDGFAGGLFIVGDFAHSVGLDSQLEGASMTVGTNVLRWSLGAGYLFPLADVVELGAGLSVAHDGFFLGDNVVLPSAEYVSLRPFARGRWRVTGDETLVVDARFGYRAALTTGAVGGAFGMSSSAQGADFSLGATGTLGAVLGLDLAWMAQFQWTAYWLSFSGMGSQLDAMGGTDSSLRVDLGVGWAF